jgi:hypothetical protein
MVTILVKKGQSTLNSIHLRRSKTYKSQEIMKVSRIEPESSNHGGQ